MDVYQQALGYDPKFKQARADWLASQENLPIARASLFPHLGLQANAAYNAQSYTRDAAFADNGPYASTQVNLTITQPIFNWALWSTISSAESSVKAATANYYFAQQDLIARVVQAYLLVLQAHDLLRYTRANKKTFAEQYDIAKQKYDVGLAPINDVYDAQAKYDQAKAQELSNINSLAINLENLHQITGHYYEFLDGLSEKGIPLATPEPNNIDLWAQTAAKQNYQLKAQHFAVEAAKSNIGIQQAGYFPSFGIQGNLSDQRQYNRNLLLNNKTENLYYDLATVAVGVNWDFFSGGSVVAETRQARYQYASASAKEESIYSQVETATRQAFLGVNSYSAQVKADALSIRSARNALESSEAAYKVGSRTFIDVLNNTTQLYHSQQSFAVDQYAYINNFVALKEFAGTLSAEDVAKISSWLTKPIDVAAAKQLSDGSDTKQPRQP